MSWPTCVYLFIFTLWPVKIQKDYLHLTTWFSKGKEIDNMRNIIPPTHVTGLNLSPWIDWQLIDCHCLNIFTPFICRQINPNRQKTKSRGGWDKIYIDKWWYLNWFPESKCVDHKSLTLFEQEVIIGNQVLSINILHGINTANASLSRDNKWKDGMKG